MGRKERKEREIKRENYATKHSAEKRKQTLIAVGVLSIIFVIVGYAAFLFLTIILLFAAFIMVIVIMNLLNLFANFKDFYARN